jgi:repressor LexA
LNLYGAAQCGPTGSILDGNPTERIPISPRLLTFPTRDAFLVLARGDSMSPDINDGDYVIVRRTTEPKSGQTMVCVNNEEVLIKKIDVGRDGQTWLVSYNPAPKYTPFRAASDFRVEGLVTGILFRRYQ